MRILALFCGAFSAGTFAAQYLIPGAYLLDFAAGAFLIACFRFLFPGDAGKRFLLIGTGLALAFGYYWLYSRQTVGALGGLYGTEQDIVMTLCDYAEPTAWGARVSVKIDGLPGKAAYYGGRELLELQPGAAARGIARLEDARRVHDSDIATFTSRGIFTLAYGRGNAEIEREPNAFSVQYWPVRTGQALRERIRATFPGDVAPFLTALLTGDRTGLASAAGADMEEAGLSHVLAVSGMHCGFLAALTGFLLRRRRVLSIRAGICCLIFYALMTGAKPSVVRACIMLSMLMLAPLFRRENDAPTTLSAALFLILLQNPFAAASVSLQLSFASVAGLLWLTPKLYAAFGGGALRHAEETDSATDAEADDSGIALEGNDSGTALERDDSATDAETDETRETARRRLARVRDVVAATFAASLGVIAFTAPLCAAYFGVLALIAPLSNLLCLWAVGAAFVTGFAVTIVSFLPIPAAAFLAWIPAFLVRYILLCAHVLAKFPLHAVYFANPLLKYWLVYAYALFALAYLMKRSYRLAAAFVCAALLVTLRLGQSAYRNGLDALTLDVGQGQSIALASHGRFALADCGSLNSWKDAGRIAGQQLRAMGCKRLDALILTHYDSDHVNGLEGLLARLDVKTLYAPEMPEESGNQALVLELAERYHVPVRMVRERMAIGFGKGHLTLFPPTGKAGTNEGLSILASVGDADLLITGDMGQDAERTLIERYALPDVEAYVVGHHGSKYSTSEELLAALRPETACISVGSNSYGHPTPETLGRLSESGCAVYRTDLDGTIHLCMNPSGMAFS